MAAFHIARFILRLLLFLALLPIIAVYALLRIWYFRLVFVRHARRCGMPKRHAKMVLKKTVKTN